MLAEKKTEVRTGPRADKRAVSVQPVFYVRASPPTALVPRQGGSAAFSFPTQ